MAGRPFFIKNTGRGGGFRGGCAGGGRAPGGMSVGRGGVNIFFFGAEMPTKQATTLNEDLGSEEILDRHRKVSRICLF